MRRRSEDQSANLKSTVEASRAHQRELEGSSHQLREELLALRSQHRDTEARPHPRTPPPPARPPRVPPFEDTQPPTPTRTGGSLDEFAVKKAAKCPKGFYSTEPTGS